jgi:hypothetical protein
METLKSPIRIGQPSRTGPPIPLTCTIEYQDPAPITTVETPQHPFILVLPIGRPYNDIYAGPPDHDANAPVIFHMGGQGGNG